MASTDKIIEGFTYRMMTPIIDQLSFEALQGLKLHLSTNAVSITSHLGNGALCLLWLCVSDQVYNTFSMIAFVPPVSLGPVSGIPADATQFKITTKNETHKREARISTSTTTRTKY